MIRSWHLLSKNCRDGRRLLCKANTHTRKSRYSVNSLCWQGMMERGKDAIWLERGGLFGCSLCCSHFLYIVIFRVRNEEEYFSS